MKNKLKEHFSGTKGVGKTLVSKETSPKKLTRKKFAMGCKYIYMERNESWSSYQNRIHKHLLQMMEEKDIILPSCDSPSGYYTMINYRDKFAK